MRSLEFGALLHDIGKIGVPDAILLKPAGLTEEEWVTMREHPLHGDQILRGISFLEGATRVVAQHHEKWDGSGYPRGLRGEEIDFNARIFAVADAFDAMTSDRVYRMGRPYELAAEELARCAGAHFDRQVVEAFLLVPAGEWESLRHMPGAGAEQEAITLPFRTAAVVESVEMSAQRGAVIAQSSHLRHKSLQQVGGRRAG
jgi:HD-GYP domain-containing protein (c-di-GMP phosphodiesterase class II)